jgi:hypothetical protein
MILGINLEFALHDNRGASVVLRVGRFVAGVGYKGYV